MIATLILAAAVLAQQKPAGPEPNLKEVTLTTGGQTLQPVAVRETWTSTRRIGAMDVAIGRDAATGFDPATGEKKWEASFEADGPMEWLADEGTTIFFSPKPGMPKMLVRRLNSATGTWLEPLPFAARALLITDDGWICFSGSDVSRWVAGKAQPAWMQRCEAAGPREEPGAFLLAGRRPDYAVDGPVPLTRLPDGVLVCAGPKADLVCLDLKTGKDVWRIPRIWEYRRGFIGPSVWAHYLGRYGVEDHDLKLAEKEVGKTPNVDPEYHKSLKANVEKARARAATQTGVIIAGPVVVPGSKPGRGSIFVVTALSDADSGWGGYLAEPVLYELNGAGEPISTAHLPRMVNPRHCQPDSPNGVIWGCPNGVFVRVGVSGASRGFGPGSSDLISRVDWYRQVEVPAREAWLQSDPAGDVVAWTPTHAFRTIGPGYVAKKGERVYRYPIAKVDLNGGATDWLTLHVPFGGDVPAPATNYSSGPEGIRTHGPYLMGVTGLSVLGESLEIVLGREGKASSVRFNLADLGLPK